MTEWQHAPTIARVELRRRWRVLSGNTAQLIALAFLGLFAFPFTSALVFGLYYAGDAVAAGDLSAPLEFARMGVVYLWLGVVAFGGFRAYATALRPDRLDGMLTTVSHRELLAGLFAAETLLWGVPVLLLAGLGSLAFAAGSGSLVVVPLAIATIGPLLATGLLAGFAGALVVRNTGVRSRLLTRLRTVVTVVLVVAYFWLLVTQAFDTVLAPVYVVLEPTPIGWYADLLLLGTVAGASVARGAGVVLASGAFVVAGWLAVTRLAAWLWYADGVHVEHEATTTSSSGESRLVRLLPQPMAGVAAVDFKRARRAPITLSFVIYPVIVLVNPVVTTVQTGTVASSFPILVALSGAWITGVLFSLNVVGNEGAVLPATLLGETPGRALVGGHVVASAVVGVPLAVVATGALAVAGPHPPTLAATLTFSALVLAAASGPIASGIGAAFPRFEAVSVSRSRKAIVPSMLAFAIFSVVVTLVALPALLGHSAIVGHALASWLGTTLTVVALAGTALSTLVAVPLGAFSASRAMRAVETFHFE